MDTMDCIYSRCSVRSYSEEQVPESIMKEILKAGSYAASGMNRQPLRFVVVQNREIIKRLSEKVKSDFLKNSDGSNSWAIAKMNDPSYHLFHNAPTLVFVFAAPDALTPIEDGSLAVGNMMLAANSMGYGTCFIGFARALDGSKGFRECCKVPDDHTYVACMCLGKPKGEPEKHPKNDVQIVNWMK